VKAEAGRGADSAMAARGDKREKILMAAICVFARGGFHHSRVSDIAREAGVADGTIYLYFKNKEEILITIFEERMVMVISMVRAALEKHSCPDDKLRCFIGFHLGQMSNNREMAEILQVELRLSNKFIKEYVPVRLTEYLDVIAEIIEEGQASGLFRPDLSSAILKRAIFGALDELAMQWVLTKGRRPDLEVSAEQLSEVFLRGMYLPHASHSASGGDVTASSRGTISTLTGGQS